jgi:geranylgeranyl pyrophosphate synthase
LNDLLQTKQTAVLLRCHELVAEELLALHFGQGMDIYWHSGKQSEDPNVDQYLQMCAYKTGTLARLSAKLSNRSSNSFVEVYSLIFLF